MKKSNTSTLAIPSKSVYQKKYKCQQLKSLVRVNIQAPDFVEAIFFLVAEGEFVYAAICFEFWIPVKWRLGGNGY